jgi:hypothetical protein
MTRFAIPFFLSVGLLAGSLAAALAGRPVATGAETCELYAPADT